MKIIRDIDAIEIEDSVALLKEYVKEDSIDPLISALEALQQDTSNETLLVALADTFNALGIVQGAVLTYAPYLSVILSNELFDDN